MELRGLFVLAAVVILCGDSLADEDVLPEKWPRPTAPAFSLSTAPTLDGEVAGDPAWQGVVPITGFTQVQPDEGQPATQKTEVYIVYNEFDKSLPNSAPKSREFIVKYNYMFDVYQ